MLKIWKRSPMLRILPAFVLGILTEIHLKPPQYLVTTATTIAVCSFLYFHFAKKVVLYSQRHYSGIFGFIAIFLLGIVCTHFVNPLKAEDHYSHQILTDDILMVRILQAPVVKEKSIKTKVELIGLINGNDRRTATGKIMVYLKKDSLSRSLLADDILLLNAKPTSIPSPQNPFEFDYKTYLANHFIYDQIYADSTKWILSERPEKHTLTGLFVTWREYMLNMMRKEVDDDEIMAVMAALILGKTDEIDFDLMSSYSSAGAIHVLAVSGLHVGLVYLMLNKILDLLFRKNKQKILRTILPVVVLWLYAGITGLSPSVLRSALMFNCFIIAANWNKTSNIYNTMAFSALLLLVINPYIINEVGFQLSYLAVLGIVVLQKKITALIFIKNKWIFKIWELTAVSIAAQLVTFPLGLLYFHQFPNYFLFSNLIIIPLSTWILYICIVYFIVFKIPYLSDLLIHTGAMMTGWMNAIVKWFDQLPHSIVHGVSISTFECHVLFGTIFFLFRWIFWHKPKSLPIALCFMLILTVTQVIEKIKILRQSEICIHSIGDFDCISCTQGETAVVFYNNQLIHNESKVKFHLKNYWDYLGIKTFHFVNTDSIREYYSSHCGYTYPVIFTHRHVLMNLTEGNLEGSYNNQNTLVIANKEIKSHYWKQEELDRLKGTSVLFTRSIPASKMNWLKQNLPAETSTFDLRSGAFIIREDSPVDFRLFY